MKKLKIAFAALALLMTAPVLAQPHSACKYFKLSAIYFLTKVTKEG